MVILGIDPGTTSIGYALIERGGKPRLLDHGLFNIKESSTAGRLKELHLETKGLISLWRPEVIAVERVFFAKNAKTAMAVAEARGVILLTASLAKITLYEYTPLEVKQAVTGAGNAAKSQVEKIVRLSVAGAEKIKATDDVFDAMAVALTASLLIRLKPAP